MTDSNETSVATFESIQNDIWAIQDLLGKYLVGDSDTHSYIDHIGILELELSDLISRNKQLMGDESALDELRGAVDTVAYYAIQLFEAFNHAAREAAR